MRAASSIARRVGVAPVGVEAELLGLLGRGLAELGAAVAGVYAEERGEPVEVALAVLVVDVAALAAHEDRHLVVRVGAHAREVHPEVALGQLLERALRRPRAAGSRTGRVVAISSPRSGWTLSTTVSAARSTRNRPMRFKPMAVSVVRDGQSRDRIRSICHLQACHAASIACTPASPREERRQPSVRLEGVVKRFGDFTAVRDLDLDIERGEFFTLLGPSGCGKTTTLRMVAGFEEPTEGRVLLDGVDVSGLPPSSAPPTRSSRATPCSPT